MNHIETEENELDIGKIVLHFRRNLNIILLITFIVTIGTAVYAYFLKPVYSSNVVISLSNPKTSHLDAILPGELSAFGANASELETVKLTLKSRKFINSAIEKFDINQHYFIEKNFRKNEVYDFQNLVVNIDINDTHYRALNNKTLYNELFKIEPIDKERYRLTLDALNYEKIHNYGEHVDEKFFSINILKKGTVLEQSYFVKVNNKSVLVDTILGNLSVSVHSSNVIKIIYTDTVAKRAKEVLDIISRSFVTYTLDKKTNELSHTLSFLEKQISETKGQLQAEGDKLQHYQEESEVFKPMELSSTLLDEMSTKEEEIKLLELQVQELKNFRKGLKDNKLNTVSLLYSGIDISSIQSLIELFREDALALNEMVLQEKNLEKSLTENPQLSELIQQLNVQSKLLDELTYNFTAGHPQVLKANSELAKLKEETSSYIATNIDKLKQNKILIKNKIVNNIMMTQSSISRKLNTLKKDLNEKHTLLQSLPGKNLTIQDLKRQFTLSENIYTFLLQKKMELEISKASTIANTQIIEDAREARFPFKPNRKLIIMIGALVGLVLGILYTLAKALLDTKIRNASTVAELTDTPLYGVLPFNNNKRFFNEALRSIRTNLQFVLPRDKQCTTMLVSSTVAGEGKTTVIAGLADIIAQTDKKVLVMDLDLRKPRLYKELKKSNKSGMTHYLIGDVDFTDLIQPINNNLDFFAAGTVPPNPSELLMSDKFKDLLDELVNIYDYILFDTAPIGSVIDANMLLQYSDIVLLVVKANSAEKVYLESFNKLRVDKNIKSAGIILNQVVLEKSNHYGYGYGYDYGYGHKEEKG